MNLYDKTIEECLELIDENKSIKLEFENEKSIGLDKQQLILKMDMAYELGGNEKDAISLLAFTDDERANDEIILLGPDLPDIKEDISFARITILSVNDNEWSTNELAYASMRNIDYTRYHIYPEGYMMRISTAADREPVRIGKKELESGLNFSKLGKTFIEAYHKHKEVKAVKIIFITDQNFEFEKLKEKSKKCEKITESLNHIFNNLIMDCTTCSMKKICDEVEGMKELHELSQQ